MKCFTHLILTLGEYYLRKRCSCCSFSSWLQLKISCSKSTQEAVFYLSQNTLCSLTSPDRDSGLDIIMHTNMLFIYAARLIAHWFRNWELFAPTRTHTYTILMSFLNSSQTESLCVCVTGAWKWRGVAGQLEHSLVKKSIKKKQRREGEKELYLLAAVFAWKAARNLSKWLEGLYIGRDWLSELEEVQDCDFLFCGFPHHTQATQFTISHLIPSTPALMISRKSLWVSILCNFSTQRLR